MCAPRATARTMRLATQYGLSPPADAPSEPGPTGRGGGGEPFANALATQLATVAKGEGGGNG